MTIYLVVADAMWTVLYFPIAELTVYGTTVQHSYGLFAAYCLCCQRWFPYGLTSACMPCLYFASCKRPNEF